MTPRSLCLLSALLLSATAQAWAAPEPDPSHSDFQRHWGGYLIATDFNTDSGPPGVIRPPANLRDGDLLLIRPLRLNRDEYLILQQCLDLACSKAQVVRAWNAYGYMGPYPVLGDKVPVVAGANYMLWMQRVPAPGSESFKLYVRDSPPLVFEPAGSTELFHIVDLKAAQKHGPSAIKKAESDQASFMVTFDRGSVVRIQALRPDTQQAVASR
jgi:hypothetical protein